MANKGFGWRAQNPDQRDHAFKLSHRLELLPESQLPTTVDHRAEFPAPYDQGQLGCHDEKTEVLTEDGWIKWSECKEDSLLATINPDSHSLEYQRPLELHTYEYKGEMYGIDHASMDFSLTPNHRMYVRPWDQKNRTLGQDYKFVEMQNIGWYSGLLASASGFTGTEIKRIVIGDHEYEGADFLALIAAITSDGYVGRQDDETGHQNRISFCCFREDRYGMLASLAHRMGFREQPSRKGVFTKHGDAALADWLRQKIYVSHVLHSSQKRVADIVKVASQSQIEQFLLYYGDQHIDPRYNTRQFYTSSAQIADDLQELLLKTGKRGGIYERDPRSTQMRDGRIIDAANCSADITVSEWKSDNLSIERKNQVAKESYDGNVYCATVPNSTLVTRRNGKVLISGNSCGPNALAGLLESFFIKSKYPYPHTPSRLFMYWNTRVLMGTTLEDSGVDNRTLIQAVSATGECPESQPSGTVEDWYVPYSDDQIHFRMPPGSKSKTDAKLHLIQKYEWVDLNRASVLNALASGLDFMVGFTVYESFMNIGADGVMPIPASTESVAGGHDVACVGYILGKPMGTQGVVDWAICRNSWGTSFGDGGYFYAPLDACVCNPSMFTDAVTIQFVGHTEV